SHRASACTLPTTTASSPGHHPPRLQHWPAPAPAGCTLHKTILDGQRPAVGLPGRMAMSIVRVPPSPPGRFFSGHLKDFRQDRLGYLTRCARDYGDIVALRIGPMRVLLLVHPDHIEQALVTDNQNYSKHYGLRMNRLLLGKGLLTSHGDFWLRQRRLAQPAFHRHRIASYAETMVGYTQRLLAGWRDGETRD